MIDALMTNIANDPVIISVFVVSALILFFGIIIAIQYRKEAKATAKRGEKVEGLFDNFYLKLYGALFEDQDPDEVAMKIGVRVEDYYHYCKITETKPNVRRLITHKIEAIILLLMAILVMVFVHVFLGMLLLIIAVILNSYEVNRLKTEAENRKNEMANDVPRFMDMLKTEAEALPIETAIYALCEKMDCLLTRELNRALNEMKLGANNWIGALEQIAEKYDVDTLNSLVIDISTAYNKGVSVASAIKRKSEEIRQTSMLKYKEQASSMTSKVLFPLMVFQFAPLLVFLLLPVFSSIENIF